MDKKGLAQALRRVATALELLDPNLFRARAYENAARAIENSPYTLDELAAEGKARALRGIGPAMMEKVQEYYALGELASQKELLEQVPPGLWELLNIRGLGTKRVRTLFEVLEVASLSELEYACHENKLLELPGFGPKLQANALQGLKEVQARAGQLLLPQAEALAREWLGRIEKWSPVSQVQPTGQVRRFTPITDCIAFLVGVKGKLGASVEAIGHQLVGLDWKMEKVNSSLLELLAPLPAGPQLKIFVCNEEHFAYHWLATTGSSQHLAALTARGFDDTITFKRAVTETEIYAKLSLDFIPAVLRETGEEVAWAAAGALPRLVQAAHLRGVLHVHTTYSDGVHSLAAMAAGAADRGWSYLGIADHSQTAGYAGGLTPAAVSRQWQEIEAYNRGKKNIRLLKGIESDILIDGRLDYEDELLRGFDFVIASLHSSLRQPAELMMPRLLAAVSHPTVSMLGHPTNRILLGREESAVDMEELLQAVAKHGKAMELNANPHRLDLDWRWCRRAKQLGIKIAINPDAHRVDGFEDVNYGLMMAQKAGLSPQDLYVPEN